MLKVTKEMLESELKGISIRLPEDFHAKIKSEASLNKISKDDLMLSLLKLGIEQYNKEE